MNGLVRTLNSTLVRKWIVGFAGLGLVIYTIVHLAGNMAIYGDPETYNAYAEALHASPLLIVAEIFLYGAFAAHIVLAVLFIARAKASRGRSYRMLRSKRGDGGKPLDLLSHRLMLVTGGIALIFLVVHVWQFRVRDEEIRAGAGGLYAGVLEILSNPGWAALYIVGSLMVGWHIYRGFQSAFRSLGVHHPRYIPLIDRTGKILAVVIGLGFAAIPVWALVKGG